MLGNSLYLNRNKNAKGKNKGPSFILFFFSIPPTD